MVTVRAVRLRLPGLRLAVVSNANGTVASLFDDLGLTDIWPLSGRHKTRLKDLCKLTKFKIVIRLERVMNLFRQILSVTDVEFLEEKVFVDD